MQFVSWKFYLQLRDLILCSKKGLNKLYKRNVYFFTQFFPHRFCFVTVAELHNNIPAHVDKIFHNFIGYGEM